MDSDGRATGSRAGWLTTWLWGVLGALMIFGIGLSWNAPLAAWVAFPLLMRFFREQTKWYLTLPVAGLVILTRFASIYGGWSYGPAMFVIIAVMMSLPVLAALYLDRAFSRRLSPLLATLLFPTALVSLEYLYMAAVPLSGTINEVATTQFDFQILSQVASVTGIFGIAFMVAWFAPVVNTVWEHGFSLAKAGRPVIIFGGVLGLVLLFGSIRLSLAPTSSPTVRVAGVTVAHERNYWDITDAGTPRSAKQQYGAELDVIRTELFERSQRAADFGARIILWSEGDYVMFDDDVDDFVVQAQAFAQRNNLYLAASVLVLRYGETKNDNMVLMFAPDGTLAYSYEKTISAYPTDSDGDVPSVETPYGTLASVICFDLDFPNLLRQAYRDGVDILLVPGYDSSRITPYHTEAGMLRAIDYGFSVVRQANDGASMAADPYGNVLAYQSSFASEDPVMVVDIPMQGTGTFYGETADWFSWLCLMGSVALSVWAVRAALRSRRRPDDAQGEPAESVPDV